MNNWKIDVESAGNVHGNVSSMEIASERLSSAFSIRPDTVFQDVAATLTPGYLEQICDAPEAILGSLFSMTGVRVQISVGLDGKQEIILRGALDQILLAKIKLESMLVNRQIQTLENHKQNNSPEGHSKRSKNEITDSTIIYKDQRTPNNSSVEDQNVRSRRKVCKPRKVSTLINNSSLHVQSKMTLNNNTIEFPSLIKKEPEEAVPLTIEEEAERKANEWLSIPEFSLEGAEGIKIENLSKTSPNTLKVPTPYQQPEFLYSCEICSFKAEREGQFLKHVLTHSKKETVHQCKKCSFASVSLSHYNRHQLSHIDATFNCPTCEFTSDDPKLLSRHVTLKHTSGISENPLKRSTLLQCNDCPYNTTKIYHFERHLLVHNRDLKGLLQVHQCEQCPYKTHRKEHIIRHRHNVHIRHRPYSCDSCHRTYKNLDSLEHHRLTHLPTQGI